MSAKWNPALSRAENAKAIGHANRTHGFSKHLSYNSWVCMIRRCYNPRDKRYARYGGRGITVCDRWRHSFEAFLEDMGTRPTGLTLERRNNDGNYEPGNCEWATRQKQRRNQGDVSCFVIDLARAHGINYRTLISRLKVKTLDEALAMGPGKMGRNGTV